MLTATIFLIAYFSACALALARHPIYGLVAYVTAYFIHPPSLWWSFAVPNLRWSLLAGVVTLIAVVFHREMLPQRPLFRNGTFVGLALFVTWLGIQSFWALEQTLHAELVDYFAKYLIVVGLIYKSVENEHVLKIFLWAHVVGCFYFGWNAFFMYEGGRFENISGPGFSDANQIGLQAVAGIIAAAGLFLAGKFWERVTIIVLVPFIVNGLVTTVSRSSFLGLLVGGVVFALFSPRQYRRQVVVLGVIALIGFAALTHDQYWDRMSTIKYAGQQVEGMETGARRLVVWEAQTRMFSDYPLGCGHRCTTTLSPYYLDDEYLTGPPGNRGRSSHNTYLTLIVEQGIVGGVFALLLLLWMMRISLRLRKLIPTRETVLLCVYPSALAILSAILVADVFVDHLKMEVRLWYIAVLLVIMNLARKSSAETASTPSDIPPPEEKGRSTNARQISHHGQIPIQ